MIDGHWGAFNFRYAKHLYQINAESSSFIQCHHWFDISVPTLILFELLFIRLLENDKEYE